MPSPSQPSSSPASSDPTSVFSVRIVSLDYYTAPPIPDLDFCYSAFQGRKVEEVPVIRIYGSTPAGQKACLHVHRALPYLYIPCPDDLLHNPEEGHPYLRVLSRAVEKALNFKSTASKRQHVHGCNLVRAKFFYGYHTSEELFIKIYLYYPHEVARAATLLLGGDILNRTFQPYESHIPYLLQFLVDYNLYGMSHLHTSKFKFRPPLPDGFIIPKEACYKKHDMLADSSSCAVGNPAIWLSSTISSALIWSDSATGHNDLEDKNTQLIRRQSICGLELDSSVDDILNEKRKLYTSLSQTGSDVKMVQSLVPIWEEEYERSGVQGAIKSPDFSKPLPENVLKTFLNGLEYENALSELCLEAQKSFPSKVSAIEEDDKLEKYIKSFTDIGNMRLSSSCDECLKFPEDYKNVPLSPGLLESEHSIPCEKKCKFDGLASVGKVISSETIVTEEPKNLENEALGLLSWLASSQAAEDLSTDDELVHEAILSPLLPTKSYKKALELAHLDYENASQQECQDILDSVEILKSEGLKEQASFSGTHDNVVSVSPDNVIPQVDGSSDDNFKTAQKDGFSEINLNIGRDKSSVHLIGKCTSKRFGNKYKKKKILWGPLPLSIKQKEHDDSEPASLNSSSDIEMKKDSESSSSSGSKDRCYDASKVDAGMETSGEKIEKMSECSVRDLMRRKRCFHAEQSESERHVADVLPEGQKDEMVTYCPEEPMHHPFERERPYVTPAEPHAKSSLINQDGVLQESMTCSTIGTQGCYLGPTDQLLQSNIIPNEHLGFRKGSSDGDCIETATRSRNFATTGLPLAQIESINLHKPCKTGHRGTAICSAFSGCHNDKKTDASQSYMKCVTSEISYCKEDLSTGYQLMKSCTCESENVDNFDECLKSPFYGDHVVDESLQANQAFASNSLTAVCAEHVFLNDASKYMSDQDGGIAQERFPQTHLNGLAGSNSASVASNLLIKNRISGELDVAQCRICTDSQKERSPLEHIEMTFSRKPPSRDEVGRLSDDYLGTSGRVGSTDICDESLAFNCSFIHSNGQGINDLPPFFIKNSEDEQLSKSPLNEENLDAHQESALGVPSHFQNDGSVLYLLTHTFSPPTLDCVHQWLVQQNCLNDATGTYKERIPSSPPSSSDPSLEYNNGLGATGCYETPSESNTGLHLKPEQSPSQENSKGPEAENHSSHIDIVSCEPQVAGGHIKENLVANSWQDNSQISGPDEKSSLTPLSQIGFRDPASVGGGQQLTLISMEVQAESRRDLRPDPQFDAINIISLAIQEDTSHTFEVYVLMRGNNEEPCGRNVDGISDCKFVIFPEEKHLLDYFVKIISSFDPDVLMGWEIQGSSLGFLAERAAHLGIGLLKKISRIPQYETKCKVRDPGNPESLNVLNEPSIIDPVLEDAIIGDEWGRTHASGIHVSGRIVLNVWRLIRAEVKLNLYTVEAVAEEVLRRKIPSISCRVLNHWFSSGPERARYRCIEYVIERAKLNFQIMNQLDMVF